MNFNERLGEHLRRLRKQKGLSLLDVEAASNKEFKASVLGAYERGERALSAARLARLADLYRLPLRAMLPADEDVARAPGAVESLAFDVQRLEATDDPDAKAALRFVRSLQSQRGEWSGRVFAVRVADVQALAAALDRAPDELIKRLEELGVRAYRSLPSESEGERM